MNKRALDKLFKEYAELCLELAKRIDENDSVALDAKMRRMEYLFGILEANKYFDKH